MSKGSSGAHPNAPKTKVVQPIREGFQPRPDNIKGYQPAASATPLDISNPPSDFTAITPVPPPKPNNTTPSNPPADSPAKE